MAFKVGRKRKKKLTEHQVDMVETFAALLDRDPCYIQKGKTLMSCRFILEDHPAVDYTNITHCGLYDLTEEMRGFLWDGDQLNLKRIRCQWYKGIRHRNDGRILVFEVRVKDQAAQRKKPKTQQEVVAASLTTFYNMYLHPETGLQDIAPGIDVARYARWGLERMLRRGWLRRRVSYDILELVALNRPAGIWLQPGRFGLVFEEQRNPEMTGQEIVDVYNHLATIVWGDT